MTMAAWLVLYMMGMVAAAILVHLSPHCDLRGVGRLRIYRPTHARDEVDFETGEALRELHRLRREAANQSRMELIPRGDIVLAIVVAGLSGVALWAVGGALPPLVISGALGLEAKAGEFGVQWIGASVIERLAQLIGAIASVAIGLRLFRATLAMGAVGGVLFLAIGCAHMLMGRPITLF